jgi:hypothetical protein
MYLSLIVDLTNSITDESWLGGIRLIGVSGGGVEDGCEGDPLGMVLPLSRVLLNIFRITDFVLDGLFIMRRASLEIPSPRFNTVGESNQVGTETFCEVVVHVAVGWGLFVRL